MYRYIVIILPFIFFSCSKNNYYTELNKYYDNNFLNRYTEEELYNGTCGEPRKNWEKIENDFTNKLLGFFNMSESMEHENIKKLSFISYIVSDDGLLKLFSWDKSPQSPNDHFETVLQYVKYEEPYALLLKEKIIPISVDNDFLSSLNYRSIINLNENIYLLFGDSTYGSSTDFVFLTVQLSNNIIVPYYSFRNLYYDLSEKDMSMFILTEGNKNASRIYDAKIERNGNKIEILVFYDENKINDFIFDGESFVGDYEKLMEIIGGP